MKHGQSVHFEDTLEGAAFTQYINNRTRFRARNRAEWDRGIQTGMRVWKIEADCPLLNACKAALVIRDEIGGLHAELADWEVVEDAVKGAEAA